MAQNSQKASLQPNAPQWNRALSAFLYLLIFAALVLYTAVALQDARESRIHNTTERGLTIAQFCAGFIEEQWRYRLAAARLAARQEELQAAARARDSGKVRRYLAAAVHMLPDVLAADVYLANGTLLAGDSPENKAPDARRSVWFKELTGDRSACITEDDTNSAGADRTEGQSGAGNAAGHIVVAVRLDEHTPASGFLIFTIKPEITDGLLKTLSGMDSSIYLINARGQIVAASDGAPTDWIAKASIPIKAVLEGQSGGHIFSEPGRRRRLLLGYAGARLPGWIVVYAQDESIVLNPTYSLATRFAVLLVPILVLITGIIVLLDGMYVRQHRLTSQLASKNSELRGAHQAQADFLASVSHGLRTPLTSMNLALSGLLETEAAKDRRRSRGSIEFVTEEIDLLNARVRNLLEMSRLEANAEPSIRVPADLTDIVAAAIERLLPVLRDREVVLQFPDEPLLVNCEPSQIETVVLNLLENAIKYVPPESPLYLKGERQGEQILFALDDCGPGIPTGEEERIFEKFHRASGGGHAQGTGLGLAICKSIVEGHGGKIGAANRAAGGAHFWFTLPAA